MSASNRPLSEMLFGPPPVKDRFDVDSLSHSPPQPLLWSGDEGDAVERLVELLQSKPGALQEVFPDGPAWGEHKLLWNHRPKREAERSSEAPWGSHDMVTYLRHTERISPPDWVRGPESESKAEYGQLYAQYDLTQMYDLSGRRNGGQHCDRGRLILDQGVESHVLGHQIDAMPSCIRDRLLTRGAELQAEHGGWGWWESHGGCYSYRDIDTDPTFEVGQNQHSPGCTLTETWAFNPAIDPSMIHRSKIGVSGHGVAKRTYQRWTSTAGAYSNVALITSFLPGTDLLGPPTKVCIRFDGCTVRVPQQDGSIKRFDLSPAMFPCDASRAKRRDRITPWSRTKTSGVLPAHASQLRKVPIDETQAELPEGLHKALNELSQQYGDYYGSSAVLTPTCAVWQLTSNDKMPEEEKNRFDVHFRKMPLGYLRTRTKGLFPTEYPSVSWEYRYQPREQDAILRTRARIDELEATATRIPGSEVEATGPVSLAGMVPRGSDRKATPDIVRVRHKGRIILPRSQELGLDYSFEPYYASCIRSEVLDVDSKFPVWYADEGIILPYPVGPQKVLIDELLSDGRKEAANKLTEWRTALRKQRGDGDWKFIGGSYSLHGCLGDG